jgi:dCMP deaminase
MIINAGISVIYYLDGYADTMSEEMLREAGVAVVKIHPDVAKTSTGNQE